MPAPTPDGPRYTAQLSMRTHAPICLVGLGLTMLVACGDTLPEDATPRPTDPPQYTTDQPLTRLREDFDNRRRIESIARAELDVNRGALTLAALRFPALDGTGEEYVTGTMQRNGLVEGDDIVLARSSAVVAPDSLELRAASSVTVGGDVRVGPGGMTIVASKRIVFLESASLDSKGPVTLMIAGPDGSVEIAGSLVTRSTSESTQPPHITILGRGSVTVSGTVRAEADADQSGGDVHIEVYNEVRIEGARASVSAYAHAGGRPGTVAVRSEADVRVLDGAAIGRPAGATTNTDDLDGAIDVQGASIIVDDYSRISAHDSHLGNTIELTARDLIRTGEGAEIRAGENELGAPLRMRSGVIDIGVSSIVAAGSGQSGAGDLEIQASSLSIAANARLTAGHGGCAPGGDVLIIVAGEITASYPGTIAAGDGATDSDTLNCLRSQPGGSITVVAHAMSGLDEAAIPGRGEPPGQVELSIDRSVRVDPIALAVQTSGEVRSVPLRRDPLAIGRVPRLIELAVEKPMGTRVVIELAGADTHEGPFDQWFAVGSENPEELAPLSGSAWLKYRVQLWGRAYDAPVLDFFDIDLAPAF